MHAEHDFDEPVYNYFTADIASALINFIECTEWERCAVYENFLQGYCSVREIELSEIEQITKFIQMKMIDEYTLARIYSKENTTLRYFGEQIRNPLNWS